MNGTERQIAPKVIITEHAQAAVELLEDIARRIRYGDPPEKWGRLVRQTGTIMERRVDPDREDLARTPAHLSEIVPIGNKP